MCPCTNMYIVTLPSSIDFTYAYISQRCYVYNQGYECHIVDIHRYVRALHICILISVYWHVKTRIMSNGSSSSKYPATRKLFVGQNMAEKFLFSPQNLFSITCYSNPSKPKKFWKSFLRGAGGVIFLFLDGEITPDLILFFVFLKFLQWGKESVFKTEMLQ